MYDKLLIEMRGIDEAKDKVSMAEMNQKKINGLLI